MIRLAFASPARLAMIQLQDVLGLGTEGRMNQPGTAGGWGWQLDEIPSPDLARRLREATEEAGRGLEPGAESASDVLREGPGGEVLRAVEPEVAGHASQQTGASDACRVRPEDTGDRVERSP